MIFPYLANQIPYTDTWGLGFMGYTDKSAAGAVAFNYFSVSTAYHKGLDEDGYNQLGLVSRLLIQICLSIHPN